MAARTTHSRDRTMVDRVTRDIRESIMSGALQGGSRILLAAIAEELGVSVIPVREALKRLETEGLVDYLPYKGARVRAISVADLEDLYRVRIHLESFACAEAALRMTPADKARLVGILDEFRSAYEEGRKADGQACHAAFHRELYAVAGSEWLSRAIQPLLDASERYQRESGQLRGEVSRRYSEHIRLLNACSGGDTKKATAALTRHLERSLRLIREHVNQDESAPAT